MRIIDARLRPATPSFFKATVGFAERIPRFVDYYKWFGLTDGGKSIKSCDMKDLIEEMDEAGIEMGIIPCRWSIFSDTGEPATPAEEAFAIMDEYPGRFETIIPGSVNYPELTLAHVEKYCVNGPAKGMNLEFTSDDPEFPKVCDKRYYPIYEYMQEKNLVLYITGGGFGGCQPIEYMGKVLTDFPHLSIVDAHAHIPDAIQGCFMAFRHENYYLLPDLYIPNSFFEPIFIDAAKSMLQDQILFGTAYPFMPIVETTRHYLNWPLPEKILEKVMGGNIARIMNI